jgi:hypothetical protein
VGSHMGIHYASSAAEWSRVLVIGRRSPAAPSSLEQEVGRENNVPSSNSAL